jgi:hypothetical protein
MKITFSTCYYILKAKFDPTIFLKWCENFLSIMTNCNVVFYTNNQTLQLLNSNTLISEYLQRENIRVIIYNLEEFYTYHYKNEWKTNHDNNQSLNHLVDWKVNMLWNEKINMVKKTMDERYFDTEFYGWCDVGYFRNRENDMHTSLLNAWPNSTFFEKMDTSKIYYSMINNDKSFLMMLYSLINTKNENGLPITPIPNYQISVAGGFFICHKDKVNWWHEIYYSKLKLYFKNNYLIKDDQIILIDCIFTQPNNFCLPMEQNIKYDNWFMFQRILS